MGSMLVGNAADIAAARRARKMFGGALRQAGMVASAAIYALEKHVDRLQLDHDNAALFAGTIADIPGIILDPETVETNIVFFDVDPAYGTAAQLIAALREVDVLRRAVIPPVGRAAPLVERLLTLGAADLMRDH